MLQINVKKQLGQLALQANIQVPDQGRNGNFRFCLAQAKHH